MPVARAYHRRAPVARALSAARGSAPFRRATRRGSPTGVRAARKERARRGRNRSACPTGLSTTGSRARVPAKRRVLRACSPPSGASAWALSSTSGSTSRVALTSRLPRGARRPKPSDPVRVPAPRRLVHRAAWRPAGSARGCPRGARGAQGRARRRDLRERPRGRAGRRGRSPPAHDPDPAARCDRRGLRRLRLGRRCLRARLRAARAPSTVTGGPRGPGAARRPHRGRDDGSRPRRGFGRRPRTSSPPPGPDAGRLLPRDWGREIDRTLVLELEAELGLQACRVPDAPGEFGRAVSALRLATPGAIAAGPSSSSGSTSALRRSPDAGDGRSGSSRPGDSGSTSSVPLSSSSCRRGSRTFPTFSRRWTGGARALPRGRPPIGRAARGARDPARVRRRSLGGRDARPCSWARPRASARISSLRCARCSTATGPVPTRRTQCVEPWRDAARRLPRGSRRRSRRGASRLAPATAGALVLPRPGRDDAPEPGGAPRALPLPLLVVGMVLGALLPVFEWSWITLADRPRRRRRAPPRLPARMYGLLRAGFDTRRHTPARS